MIRVLALIAALLGVTPALAQSLPANLDKANAIVIDSTKGRIVIALRACALIIRRGSGRRADSVKSGPLTMSPR